MPDLKSDIIGRIRRLALRPTERNALTPVFEAVHNSVRAITERFGDDAVKKGRVDITIIRDEVADTHPVTGFDVEDNGIGFTEENYQSFLTPDSRLKEKKGGKGVGRLAWLKVFDHVNVESTFVDASTAQQRRFRFRLAEHNQVDEEILRAAPDGADIKTRISFRGFDSAFASRCPVKPETLALRVLSHFVPLFVGGNAPKVIIHDDEARDIEALFTDSIVDQRTRTLPLESGEDPPQIQIWSLKCQKSVRFDGGGCNFGFITGDKRSVIDYSIDDQIGLHLLDGQYIYLGCASGEYLDLHINSERTGFTLEGSEIDSVKRLIAREAREFLKPYVDIAVAEKVRVAKEVIIENPQFLYIEQDLKTFAEQIQPNLRQKEDIFLELSRNRFRRQRTFASVERTIVSAAVIDDAVNKKIEEYTQYVTLEKKGALAEYVIRRKAVIDLFEKFLEYKNPSDESYQKEEAIHKLICPMRVDSSVLEIKDHNLWLLDDRLAFFHYFASDKPANSYAGVSDIDRPDLAFFYDSCVAWRERENTDTVVLVEFKKPMRDDYTSGRDPVQQILHYVKLLRTESSVHDVRGRAIRGINAGTAFHCYVVGDITTTFEASIIGRFTKTPDGQGYFGYSPDPPAFIEIVPYGKILSNAKIRHALFFQTLGITSEG
ncbi:MAG TPA: hypothetical protein VGL83_08730 [Stellaceae bacterium]|jgi:hypothetical protein